MTRIRRMPRVNRAAVEAFAAVGYLWDDQIPGFGLRLLPSGRKVYVLRYGLGARHKSRQLTIGRHGGPWAPDPITGAVRALTADLARQEALRLLGERMAGRDPAASQNARRLSGVSFEAVAREQLVRAELGERTRAVRLNVLEKHVFPRIGSRPIASLTRADVRELVTNVGPAGSRVLERVRWAFLRAIEDETVAVNPCVGVKKIVLDSTLRDRYIS